MSNLAKSRKVRNTARTNWIFETYRVPNPLTGKMLICDASLERDFAIKNVFDPDVIYIDTKPQSCLIQTTGQRYTSDAVIGRKDNSIRHCEVKTSSELETQKNKRKFKAIAQEFDDAGATFKTISELDIHDGDTILNLKILLRYRNIIKPKDGAIDAINLIVRSNLKITFGELKEAAKTECFNVRDVWYCLANNLLLTDLTIRITSESIIWSKQDEI